MVLDPNSGQLIRPTKSYLVDKKSGGSSSKDKGNGKSGKGGLMSRDSAKSTLRNDPFAASLSSRTGMDKFMHESAYDAPWNPMGAAGRR